MKIKTISLFCLLSFGLFSEAQTSVSVYTNKGNFELEIYDHLVPVTGNNFLSLVKKKFYDGVIFHRVIKDFMIQGGDPTGIGTGGPGYKIADEFHSDLKNNKKFISMANAGPNTGGSQFFINTKNNYFLNNKHSVFGKVTKNYKLVEALTLVKTAERNRPIDEIRMDSVRIGDLALTSLPELEEVNCHFVQASDSTVNSLVFNVFKSKDIHLKIKSLNGRIVKSELLSIQEGETIIDLESLKGNPLNPGFYTILLDDYVLFDKKYYCIIKPKS